MTSNRRARASLFVGLCGWAAVTAAAPADEMLANGGMERPYAGGLPQGWTANVYGSNAVAFAEAADAHGGGSALRVACTAFADGGVQFHSARLAVEKGRPYTLVLWLKGDVRVPVTVCLRQCGAPYTPYLKRVVRVRPAWTPVVIAGESCGTDPAAALFVNYAGTGTLAMDDASLVPGLRETALAELGVPPSKGNRVYNGGFEAGAEGWTPVGRFALGTGGPHGGSRCARVGREGIECRPFPVLTGQRYTLSAWIRSAAPTARVTLRAFEWADDGGDQPDAARPGFEASVTATNGWTRCVARGLALPHRWESFVARIVPSGDVWVDDVQVEEGDLGDYAPACPVEVGAETPTRWCWVGDAVAVTARVACAQGAAVRSLAFTLEDFWSRPVETVVRGLRDEPEAAATFAPPLPGLYRVRVRADGSPATGEVWFGVFPRRDRRPRPDSPFGMHATMTVPEPTETLRLAEAMGARWIRLHDFGDFCHWRVVEPEKGHFVWHDAEVDALRARGFGVFANLGHPPLWAGRDGGAEARGNWTPAPPRDAAEWANYVYRTVEHYRGRITQWEVWNEPYWKGFFSGTPEEYAELLKAACREIKRADPTATVIGGCFSPHMEAWTRRVLDRGALDAMDALSYHVYWSPPLTESAAGEPAEVERQVAQLRALMREHGAEKPIYMSEGGIRCPPFASWLPHEGFVRGAPFGSVRGEEAALTGADAAAALVRGLAQMLTAGVRGVGYYYAGSPQGAMPWFSTMANGYYVLVDYDRRPKPTLMAYSAMESMLDGTHPLCAAACGDVALHVFAGAEGRVAVAWSASPRRLAPPRGVKAFDLMGNPMPRPELRPGEPVYLRAPPDFEAWARLF